MVHHMVMGWAPIWRPLLGPPYDTIWPVGPGPNMDPSRPLVALWEVPILDPPQIQWRSHLDPPQVWGTPYDTIWSWGGLPFGDPF